MLVNSKDMLIKALKGGYAVPSYNINNLEWAKYVLEACNEDKSPVIIAVSEITINYLGGYKVACNLIKSLIKDLNIEIPVCIHLDHGKSILSCKKAIDAGFTSVMIDASDKTLDKNIIITNEVINIAKIKDVSVEAEIGSFDNTCYSNSDDVKRFAMETVVDSIAPAVGNKHGIYKEEAKLDFELLGQICKNVKIPLVLHGASGLDENKLKTAIFCGVCKVNINTELQVAWASSVKKYIEDNPNVYDPRKIISSGEKAIKKVVHMKNEILGSKNKSI